MLIYKYIDENYIKIKNFVIDNMHKLYSKYEFYSILKIM